MGALAANDIADLVASTLDDLGPPKFEQIAQKWQHLEVMPRWFKKDKMVLDSGKGIQRTLMNALGDAAEHVGLTDTDSVDIPDLLDLINVDWVHAQTKWGFIYQTDILMNRGRALIVNVINPRRDGAMISLAEELEKRAWQVPNVGSKTVPNGVPYYVVTNATTGFNGGLPSGPDGSAHTTVAGVSLTKSPTYKNWTAQYTTVSKTDLIKKMRTGHRRTGWHSPVLGKDYSGPAWEEFRYYCKEATLGSFEDIGEAQNENLGKDLAPYGGARDVKFVDYTITFRKHPIIWLPFLDDAAFVAANNPVYQVDHNTFYPVCLKGDYLREQRPEKAPQQHNVFRVFVDLSYQYICMNRRRNAVYDTAA